VADQAQLFPEERPKVTAVIGNRKTKFWCEDPDTHLLLKEQFRYRPPGYFFTFKFKKRIWDGWLHLAQRGSVATGLFLEQQKNAAFMNSFDWTIEDQRTRLKFRPLTKALKALSRPFQLECLEAMKKASDVGGIILAGTGTGKTFIFALYAYSLKGSACLVVDELTLLSQAILDIGKVLGEEIGEVGQGIFNPKRITVATAQTLSYHEQNPKFRPWFEKLDAIVLDEFHKAMNKRSLDVIRTIQPSAVFGLTATLRLEKDHVRLPATALTGPLIFEYDITEAVQQGYAAKGVALIVSVEHRGVDQEAQESYAMVIARSRIRNDCTQAIVEQLVKQNYYVILLVEQLAHLRILSQRLEHIEHEVVQGSRSRAERMEIKDRMQRGELHLILATRVFATGIDISRVDAIVDATGSSDPNGVKQRYGRLARIREGKRKPLYVDIADKSPTSDKRDKEFNPFGAASARRLRAIRELQIPIVKTLWRGNPKELFEDERLR
jgi:superfamily II DNA or RNA helicase